MTDRSASQIQAEDAGPVTLALQPRSRTPSSATATPTAAVQSSRSPSKVIARTAVRAGLSPVIGETAPSGPRRMASVVTPNVIAIRQASSKAGTSAGSAGGCKTTYGAYVTSETAALSR